MKEKVLITGGTGLVGSRLTELLLNSGYEVSHLSRTPSDGPIKTYVWDIEKQEMDPEAIREADHIIHLAGANLGKKRWTDKRKKEIVSSRVDSAKLLYKYLSQEPNEVRTFISASAMGYYGDNGDTWVTEEFAPGQDFVAQVCVQWESAARQMETLNKRVVMIRSGHVLAAKDGIVPKIKMPMDFGLDIYFGSGEHFLSWIHIDDLCRAYIFALENDITRGPYNASAPQPVTNKDFVKQMKKGLNKQGFLIPAPRTALHLVLGEMGDVILYSIRLSSEKLLSTGIEFEFVDARKAIAELYPQ